MLTNIRMNLFTIIAVIVLLAPLVVACNKFETETLTETPGEILNRAASVTLVSYDVAMSGVDSTGTKKIVDNTARVWVKGNRMRVRLTYPEQPVEEYLIDWDAHTMYTWDRAENAIREQKNAWEIPEMTSAMYWARQLAFYDTKFSGAETIDGKPCFVVDCAKKQDNGQPAYRAWIWKKAPFLVQVELVKADREYSFTTRFNNIEFSDIPDSVFELP